MRLHLRKTCYPQLLLSAYIFIWVLLAVRPLYRSAWWIENIVVFLAVPFLVLTYRRFRFSNTSYTLIFLLLVIQAIGAHYTYAEVPFGFWLQQALGLSRNHFDRIAHLCLGLLLAYPLREALQRKAGISSLWSCWLAFEAILAYSAVIEIFEWVMVASVSPQTGIAYLGAQGDLWDAQKDMFMAGIGAGIAMLAVAWHGWRYGQEFRNRLRVNRNVMEGERSGDVAEKTVAVKRKGQ